MVIKILISKYYPGVPGLNNIKYQVRKWEGEKVGSGGEGFKI
jgi:hypothetical protein